MLGYLNGSSWAPQTARELFVKYYRRMRLLNVFSGPLIDSDFDNISLRMKPIVALLKMGANMEKIYAPRTIDRHRAYFRKIGYDINVPVSEKKSMKLAALLASRNRIVTVPEWLTLRRKRSVSVAR
jgi:hypothetical protein